MRSRSSRLFIVLLHLVGVSTNLPGNSFLAALFPNGQSGMGIVGVNPLAILLEPLELQVAGGLEELLNHLEIGGHNVDETLLKEPYWLQDDSDGKCLGPAGFSDCGDATLWKIRRRKVRKCNSGYDAKENCRRRGPLSFLWRRKAADMEQDDEPQWEYGFELFGMYPGLDVETEPESEDENIKSGRWWKGKVREEENIDLNEIEAECMMFLPSPEHTSGNVGVGECDSKQAWLWRISEDGALHWDTVKSRENVKEMKLHGKRHRTKKVIDYPTITNELNANTQRIELILSECVWRFNSTDATIMPCSRIIPDESTIDEGHVRFSVIQYQSSGHLSPTVPRLDEGTGHKDIKLSTSFQSATANALGSTSNLSVEKIEGDKDHSHLPTRKRTSQDSASSRVLHPEFELKTASALVFNNKMRSLSQDMKSSPLSDIKSIGYSENKGIGTTGKRDDGKILHHTRSSGLSKSKDILHKPRKIPVHPYIAASKDGIYEDQLTGLTYDTDLSTYLGHDRKLSGRHTLMGVGIYYRTMLKIKVYGVALYVSKRDVLADAGFNPFAHMSTEELRKCPEFYDHLLGSGDLQNSKFDKTLFIKINMQLSVASIRGSLESDWTYLSPDHKKMLIDSTFKVRHADERMIETIKDEENSSRCSCAQIAPESYQADSSCCARGTELVFTWRKNGDLELRIDGRIIDIFQDPDVAKGIFYEYLRGDDPISFDARDHFGDGFPFLLAPLAQVKGVSSPVQPQDSTLKSNQSGDSNAKGVFGNTLNIITSHITQASDWMQGNVQGGMHNIASRSRALSSATQNFGAEIHNFGNKIYLPENFKFITERLQNVKRRHLNPVVLFQDGLLKRDNFTLRNSGKSSRNDSSTKRPNSDEIIVDTEPSKNFTHMLVLYMVHFYLVLLLIVSLPDSYTIRLVVKRPPNSIGLEDEETNLCRSLLRQVNLEGGLEVDEVNSTQGMEISSGHNMKKALSYYL